MDSHPDDAETDSRLQETQYLLDRWRFSASESGFLWIQPVGPMLSPEELAGFLLLLKRGCDSLFPKAVLFEFGDVRIVGEQWTVIEALLMDFAHTLDARFRIVPGRGRPASAALIFRREGDLALLAAQDGERAESVPVAAQ